MRTMLFAVTLAVVSIVSWPAAAALAQDQQIASGTISELGAASITLGQDRGGAPMKFGVDSNTQVEARGAGTTTRRLAAAGKPGPSLADLLSVGQAVKITYQASSPMPVATLIRVVPKVENNAPVVAEMRSMGTVKSLGADSITIVGSGGGGASFTQTFVIGPETRVVGKGLGTAAAAKGGKAPFSELIAAGDHVSVSYHKSGDTLQASDVRVTTKH